MPSLYEFESQSRLIQDTLFYKENHPYTTTEWYVFDLKTLRIHIDIPEAIWKGSVYLGKDGVMVVAPGFNWDGASSVTIDTMTWFRPSLMHDTFYRFMRWGLLDYKTHRILADKAMKAMCLNEGMNAFRAEYSYRGVRIGAKKYAKPPRQDVKVICVN